MNKSRKAFIIWMIGVCIFNLLFLVPVLASLNYWDNKIIQFCLYYVFWIILLLIRDNLKKIDDSIL